MLLPESANPRPKIKKRSETLAVTVFPTLSPLDFKFWHALC